MSCLQHRSCAAVRVSDGTAGLPARVPRRPHAALGYPSGSITSGPPGSRGKLQRVHRQLGERVPVMLARLLQRPPADDLAPPDQRLQQHPAAAVTDRAVPR